LWASNLPRDLLWQTDGGRTAVPARSSTYRAPSWSWLSIDCAFSHDAEVFGRPEEARSLVRILDVNVEPATADRTGPIEAASLTLRGLLRSLRILEKVDSDSKLSTLPSPFNHPIRTTTIIVDPEQPTEYSFSNSIGDGCSISLDNDPHVLRESRGLDCHCLLLTSQREDTDRTAYRGLLLRQLHPGTYHRLGTLKLEDTPRCSCSTTLRYLNSAPATETDSDGPNEDAEVFAELYADSQDPARDTATRPPLQTIGLV